MISLNLKGEFKTKKFLEEAIKSLDKKSIFDKYGKMGVRALESATPKDSGRTADCWSYEVITKGDKTSIVWKNDNVHKGANVAVLIQYGHGTGTGGYVHGIDYVNPAMKPIFTQMASELWKEVTK